MFWAWAGWLPENKNKFKNLDKNFLIFYTYSRIVSQRIKINSNADTGYAGVIAADYPLSQLSVAMQSGVEGSQFFECTEPLKECILINTAGEVIVWPKSLDGENNLYFTRQSPEGKTLKQPLTIANMLTFDLNALVKTDSIGQKVISAGAVKRSCLDSFNRETQNFLDLSAITQCQTVDNVKICPISGTDVYNVVVTREHKLVEVVQYDSQQHTREANFVSEFASNSTVYDDCTGVVRDDMIDDSK